MHHAQKGAAANLRNVTYPGLQASERYVGCDVRLRRYMTVAGVRLSIYSLSTLLVPSAEVVKTLRGKELKVFSNIHLNRGEAEAPGSSPSTPAVICRPPVAGGRGMFCKLLLNVLHKTP